MPNGEIASLVGANETIRNERIKNVREAEHLPPKMGPMMRYGEDFSRITNALSPFSQQFSISPFGFPGYANFPGQAIVSDIDTLSHNFRWYFISNFRQHISEAYVEYGIVRRAVDVPVDDAYRGGVTIKSEELDQNDIRKLILKMRREKDLQVANRAQKWARLFGGGGVLLLAEDQDPIDPLDIGRIKKDTKIEFRAVDLWELFWDLQNTDGYDPSLQVNVMDYFNYYGENIHKSRVWRVNGFEIPSFVRPRFRGWGASMLEAIVRPLNQYLKHTDVVFEVMDEFKLDVYMIDGFMQALSTPQGEELMMRRIQHANGRKNFQNATVLDRKDEFQQRQLSFTGLSEILKDNRIHLASELGFPVTKLFGLSATGYNAGEEDLENYNMMVEGTVRDDSEYLVLKMVEIRCQQLFGFVPDDLEVEFKPLRVLGALDESTMKSNKATILDNARNRGDISKIEYREAANAGNLIDIKLDTSDEVMQALDEEAVSELNSSTALSEEQSANGGDKPKASDEGGASKGNVKEGGKAKTPGKDTGHEPKGKTYHE